MIGNQRASVFSSVIALVAGMLVSGAVSVATAPSAMAVGDPIPARWSQIDSPGGGVTCAVSKTGQLWCWGKAEGPRGVAWNPAVDPSAGTAIDPVRVGTASNWVKVQISARHACGLNSLGEIWCWGSNAHGQLGQGDTTDRQTPTKVYLPPTGWTDVSVGTDMTCGLRLKTAYCWGDNTHSELFPAGQQAAGDITLPRADTVNLAGSIANLTLGAHLCLRSDAGEVQCLWKNGYMTIPHPVGTSWKQIEVVNPSRTSTDSGWDTAPLAVANYHLWDVCGVRSDGVAQCFNFEDLTLPATLGAYTDWISISYRSDTPRWPVCGLHGDPANPTVSCFSGYGHENQAPRSGLAGGTSYGPGIGDPVRWCSQRFESQASGSLSTAGCRTVRLNYHDTAADIAVEPGPFAGNWQYINWDCETKNPPACYYIREWQSGVLPGTQQLDFDPGTGAVDPVVSLNGAFFIEQVARYPEYVKWGRMFALTRAGRLLTIGDKGRNERQDGRVDSYPMDFGAVLAAPPTLTSSNDALAPVGGGKRVTLNGTYLVAISDLTVDGLPVTGIQETDAATSVSFIVPAHPAKGPVTVSVTTPGGTTTLPNAFTYGDPPSAPTVTGVTPGNGTIAVNWSLPSSAGDSAITGYTATASPANQSCSWTSGPLACTITGLANGVAQTVTVVATSAVSAGTPSAPSASVTPRTVPGAPSVTAVSPGVASITLTWAAPASNGGSVITGYTATASPGSAQCFGGAADSGCTINSLTNGQPYTVTVTATNAAGTGSPSTPSPSVTPRTIPGAPTGVSATPADRGLVVAWLAPVINGGAAVTSYTATASPGTSSCTVPAPGLSCTVPNLTNGQPYSITVKATNPAGEGPASVPVNGTPRTVPGAPIILAATPGNAQVSLTWRANADDGTSPVTGFVATVNPGNKRCITDAVTTSCVVSGLTNGGTYNATVVSTNAAGDSAASTPTAVVPRTNAAAPVLTSVVPGSQSALVTWVPTVNNGGAGIDSYTATASVGGSPVAQCPATGADTQCTLTGLANGTTYSVSVVATNVVGDSAASNAINVTPRTTPGAPTVTSVIPGDARATVSWQLSGVTGGSAVTGVIVTAHPDNRTCSATPPTNSCAVLDLVNGTTYTFTVVAANAAGRSAETNSIAYKVVQRPGAPAMSAAEATSGQVTLNWTPPVSDGGAPITTYTATLLPGGATCVTSGLQCVITGLTDGTGYTARVKATNDVGDSLPSGAVSFTPARTPNAPGSVVVVRGDQSVDVTWTAPSDDGGSSVSDYLIKSRRITSGGTFVGPTCDWVSGPLSCTIDRLINGDSYVVDVIAINAEGQSAAQRSLPVRPMGLPSAVRFPKAIATGPGRFSLSFTPPFVAGGAKSLTYQAACSARGVATLRGQGKRSPLLVTGALKGVTYRCTLTARNEIGAGPTAVVGLIKAL